MSRAMRKWIEENAVGGSQLRFDNNQAIRWRNAANTADISVARVNTADEFEFLTQPKLAEALPMPSAAKDLVTVEFVQNFFDGKQDPKEGVDVLANSNIALTGVHPLEIDDIEAEDGFEIGLIGQTDKTENGPYIYTVTAGNYTLTRRSDFNEDSEVSKGAYFPVTSGTEYGGAIVILTTTGDIELGTTELDFIVHQSPLVLIAGDMVSRLGNTFSIDLATLSGLESTNPGNANGQLRVKTDTAAAEKDRSTRRDPVTGAVVAKKSRRLVKTLDGTDVANGYLDLPEVAETDSVRFQPAGAPEQHEDVDFSVNYTGGASSKTRVTWINELAAGGVSEMVVGEKVVIYYRAFV